MSGGLLLYVWFEHRVQYMDFSGTQLVTCIPTQKLPKSMTFGGSTREEIELLDVEEAQAPGVDEMGRRGQILWIRGLTRLQHQVKELLSDLLYPNAARW